MIKKISPLWSKLSQNVLGNPNGRHCHWCKKSKSIDGDVFCKLDKKRKRSFITACDQFDIQDWYCDDENYTKI